MIVWTPTYQLPIFQRMDLKFTFPFYGHYLNNITLTTGGKHQEKWRLLDTVIRKLSPLWCVENVCKWVDLQLSSEGLNYADSSLVYTIMKHLKHHKLGLFSMVSMKACRLRGKEKYVQQMELFLVRWLNTVTETNAKECFPINCFSVCIGNFPWCFKEADHNILSD